MMYKMRARAFANLRCAQMGYKIPFRLSDINPLFTVHIVSEMSHVTVYVARPDCLTAFNCAIPKALYLYLHNEVCGRLFKPLHICNFTGQMLVPTV